MSVDELVESLRKIVAPRHKPVGTGKTSEVVAFAKAPAATTALPSFATISEAPLPQVIKMIALDMDGTLLSPKESITPRVHHAIHLAAKRGIHVVLATARPPRSVRFYHRALKLQTPIISHNGG